MYAIVVA